MICTTAYRFDILTQIPPFVISTMRVGSYSNSVLVLGERSILKFFKNAAVPIADCTLAKRIPADKDNRAINIHLS